MAEPDGGRTAYDIGDGGLTMPLSRDAIVRLLSLLADAMHLGLGNPENFGSEQAQNTERVAYSCLVLARDLLHPMLAEVTVPSRVCVLASRLEELGLIEAAKDWKAREDARDQVEDDADGA